MAPRPRSPANKRERLLQSAIAVFAEVGFHKASVRMICAHAGANVAAVKYYFGDKDHLYREALTFAYLQVTTPSPMPVYDGWTDAGDGLRAYIRWFLGLIITKQKAHPDLVRLMFREMQDPSPLFGSMVDELAGPVQMELKKLVNTLLGPRAGELQRRHAVQLVMAMCAQYESSEVILNRLGYPMPATPEELDELARAVGDFALGGIALIRSRSEGA